MKKQGKGIHKVKGRRKISRRAQKEEDHLLRERVNVLSEEAVQQRWKAKSGADGKSEDNGLAALIGHLEGSLGEVDVSDMSAL